MKIYSLMLAVFLAIFGSLGVDALNAQELDARIPAAIRAGRLVAIRLTNWMDLRCTCPTRKSGALSLAAQPARSARYMPRIAIIAFALLSQAVSAAANPIDALTKRLNDHAGGFGSLWANGLYPRIHLPASASTTDVLDEAIRKTGFSEGHIKHYSILSTRSVSLRTPTSTEYVAVLLDSDLGKKILLMRYESETTGWWTRFFDAQ